MVCGQPDIVHSRVQTHGLHARSLLLYSQTYFESSWGVNLASSLVFEMHYTVGVLRSISTVFVLQCTPIIKGCQMANILE